MLFHLAKDPSLFRAVRDEAAQAITVDPTTGAQSINVAKLVALPLIQSAYLEALRVYVSVTITRETVNPIILQGHKVPRGAFVQEMTAISHLEEEVWARDPSDTLVPSSGPPAILLIKRKGWKRARRSRYPRFPWREEPTPSFPMVRLHTCLLLITAGY